MFSLSSDGVVGPAVVCDLSIYDILGITVLHGYVVLILLVEQTFELGELAPIPDDFEEDGEFEICPSFL